MENRLSASIGVIEENNDYIRGLDLHDDNKFKAFSKKNIIGEVEISWQKEKPAYHNKRDSKGRFVK
jgi:hypothetical protein